MTALLVSVRDADEARDALEAGADLIDVKEPSAGSLGAASPAMIAAIVRVVGSRRPLSVALGEVAARDADLKPSVDGDHYFNGIQFAKLGLAGCAARPAWRDDWGRALTELPASVSSVAVVYADWQIAHSPEPGEVIDQGNRLGCRAMLIDTFDKRGRGLLGLWSIDELRTRIAAARAAGMLIVLGGQVTELHLPRLLPLEADFIAVRGAVCRGDRSGRLDPARVTLLKHRLNPGRNRLSC
ncbi:MAG TPA: (5-formylfuran-3-yl)methyl phosphate synthase [Pirellulales bacterium]|nr:(5-formylfuran-3-yl)methyl phosphate synthase [Pirellulales bacterium]